MEKFDAVDLIITALRDHEKAFDRMLERLERFTERTTSEGFSYSQALKAVMAQAYAIQGLTRDPAQRRTAVEVFVQALSQGELIPADWVPDLVKAGAEVLQVAEVV